MKKENVASRPAKRKSRWGEIFRFIVIGCLCTLIDLVIEYALGLLFANNLSQLGSSNVDGNIVPGYGSYISLAICVTMGFVISMVVNFFFSRKWVFQDVDKNTNYNTPKYFWSYAGLAFGGLLLGIGIQCLCLWLVNEIWHMNLSIDPFQKVDWTKLFHKDSISIWAFFAVFCIKTLIVLIYNYWTRKHLIFKAPKPTVVVDEASTAINDKVIVDHYSNNPTVFSDIAPSPAPEKKEKKETVEEKVEPKAPVEEKKPAQESAPVTKESKVEPIKATVTVEEVVAPVEEKKTEVKAKPVEKSAPAKESVSVVYGKPQFKWGKPLTKRAVTDMIYSSLELYDKRKSPVTNKERVKEIIVEVIHEEEEKKKNETD